MPVFLAVALGGALGALARYGTDTWIERRALAVFPWSTLAINLSGCFAAGVVVAVLVDRVHAPAWIRVGVTLGFLGAYTTFSTFAQETLDLVEARETNLATANAVASVGLGVAAVAAGVWLGRAV